MTNISGSSYTIVGLSIFLVVTILSSMINPVFTSATSTVGKTTQGVQTAINQTGQFVGNVSETIAENPVVTNVTEETQKFFAEKSQ